MERLTERKEMAGCNAAFVPGNSCFYSSRYRMFAGDAIERLAAIEDILGDTYDLSRLRELLEVCKGKTPDQVAGIFEEWSHYLKFSAEKNAIEGALNSIYQGGGVDYGRLSKLVEADRDGRCVVLPCKKGEMLKRNGLDYRVDHVNIVFTTFAHDETVTGRERLGLFTVEQAEAALNERKAVDDSWFMKRFTKVI